MKIKKLDASFSIGFNLNVSRLNNIVNSLRNVTNNNSYGLNFSIYKYKEKKFDFNYYSSINYNTSISSIQPDTKTNYFTQNHNVYLNYTLPYKFEVNTNVSANLRQRISIFDQNNNVVVWNGYVGRKMLKHDKGMLRVQVNDILDQNRGYNRFINSSIIREENYTTLRRYLLLTFVWNFTKTPGGGPGMQ